MKCSGIVKEKNKRGKQVTRVCGEKLDEHAIFCNVCGHPTDALKTGLSSRESIRSTWQNFKEIRSKSYTFAILMIVLLGLTIYFTILTADNYLYNNLVLLIMVPLLLIPMAGEKDFQEENLDIGSYVRKLKNYPVLFIFILMNIIYFLLLKVICTGFLLGLATDPILHIVRFILVLYWITIVFPVPFLIFRKRLNPFKAIYTAYKAGDETRWQQFYLLLAAGFAVLLGGIVFVVGMLVTIPFFYVLLEDYYKRMDEYRLFDLEGRK